MHPYGKPPNTHIKKQGDSKIVPKGAGRREDPAETRSGKRSATDKEFSPRVSEGHHGTMIKPEAASTGTMRTG